MSQACSQAHENLKRTQNRRLLLVQESELACDALGTVADELKKAMDKCGGIQQVLRRCTMEIQIQIDNLEHEKRWSAGCLSKVHPNDDGNKNEGT
jgi:hypothetical protein